MSTETETREDSAIIDNALSTLKERERLVIELRFFRSPKETLEAIAKRLGVSRERIRQVECNAIRKLRESSEELKEVWDPIVARKRWNQ